MTSKHTPGPWEAHQRPEAPIEYGHHVTTADGLTVCNVTYQLPERVDGEVVEVTRIANARLIAAAPELLEACRKLVEWHGNRAGFGDGLLPADQQVEWLANAMRAIAKATGEPQ